MRPAAILGTICATSLAVLPALSRASEAGAAPAAPACEDAQTNCVELITAGYGCETDLHAFSPKGVEAGLLLSDLCCATCAAPPASCEEEAICGTEVVDDYHCAADMSMFMTHLDAGTTLAQLCPTRCDPTCGGAPDAVPQPEDARDADGLIVSPDSAGKACADDMHWGSEHGDCSTYAPGQENDGYCERDGADAHCLISCGICTGGDDSCWSGDFSFARCCGGGPGGAPPSQPLPPSPNPR